MTDEPKWILPPEAAAKALVTTIPDDRSEPLPENLVPVRCVFVDDDGNEVGEFDAVIDPAKWVMRTAKAKL
jgi:hypothetical protein